MIGLPSLPGRWVEEAEFRRSCFADGEARATIQQGVAIKRSRALPGGLMLDFEDGERSEESQYTEVWYLPNQQR